MNNEQIDQGAVNLAKAIRQNESGGQMIKGKSGEYGAYQFTPDTWNAVAPKYGFNVPLEQSTLEQQNAVAYHRIKEWKDQGKDVTQIASMWNAGEGEPDAYKGTFTTTTKTHKAGDPSVGVNSSGAKYDVPTYAKQVATAYAQLKNGGEAPVNTENPSYAGEQPEQPKPKQTGFLADNPVLKTIGGLTGTLGLGKGISQSIFFQTKEGKDTLDMLSKGQITQQQFDDIVGGGIQTPGETLKGAGQTALTVATLPAIVEGAIGLTQKLFSSGTALSNSLLGETISRPLGEFAQAGASGQKQILMESLKYADTAENVNRVRDTTFLTKAIKEIGPAVEKEIGVPGAARRSISWTASKTWGLLKGLLKLGAIGAGIGGTSGLVQSIFKGPEVNQ